jgi:GT2 family glycosyltransferase
VSREQLVIVVIGRNEGERLRAALGSTVNERCAARIFVDSGSTDHSVAIARSFGDAVSVHEADPARPFTAARGRNEGLDILLSRVPDAAYVQFLDGDCVLAPDWVDRALDFFETHPDVGVLAGRLREDTREKNVYHRLADMEWDVPSGDVESTGGICMMRIAAFREAGGFDPSIPAGEELNLALRIKEKGYRIVRIAEDMALHDIKMQHFKQWWKRAKRYGHATAESLYLYGIEDRQRRKELASILAWGAALPSAAFVLALPTLGTSLSLLAGYPVLFMRVRKHRLEHGDRPDDAALYATAQVLAKFAGVTGVLEFGKRWLKGDLSHGKH